MTEGALKTALVIVDMQRYYIDEGSSFHKYYEHNFPGSMDYITRRCFETVLPNIRMLLGFFRKNSLPVIFLRLCGKAEDRSDLHKAFQEAHNEALSHGFKDLYPLSSDSMADMPEDILPEPGEAIIDKTTFSAFTSSDIDTVLKEKSVGRLLMTGLATSQCVDTTARDAADRGYEIIHIDDAQADYDENMHGSSLTASAPVCGGVVIGTRHFLESAAMKG